MSINDPTNRGRCRMSHVRGCTRRHVKGNDRFSQITRQPHFVVGCAGHSRHVIVLESHELIGQEQTPARAQSTAHPKLSTAETMNKDLAVAVVTTTAAEPVVALSSKRGPAAQNMALTHQRYRVRKPEVSRIEF